MKKTILVIDDEKTTRDSFLLALKHSKINVITAKDGNIGLKKLMETPVELVFLDLKMPRTDGIKVFEQIRKANKKIPIYIITAFQQEYFSDIIKLRNTENNSFQILKKPLVGSDLKEVVEDLLKTLPN